MGNLNFNQGDKISPSESFAVAMTGKDGIPYTTSEAISKGSKNEHSSVIRLIRDNVADLQEFGRVGFENQPFVTNGGQQTREIAILNEQQATLLLTYMRNNDVVRSFKKTLVKAFFDLSHNHPAFHVPTTMAEALRLAADQAEELERQQAQIEAQKPAVEFVERYTDSTGLVSLTQAAKDLQFKPRAFTNALEHGGYLYRSGGALTPYQKYLDQGLFAMVNGEKGGHGYSQTKITTKGKSVFAQRFASELG